MIYSGVNENEYCREILELKDHPFYFATQYHPELKSRPDSPSKPFVALMLAAIGILDDRIKEDGGVLKIRHSWKDYKV